MMIKIIPNDANNNYYDNDDNDHLIMMSIMMMITMIVIIIPCLSSHCSLESNHQKHHQET